MTSKTRTTSNLVALICLIGPALIAALYFVFLAQPLYQTEVRFRPQPADDSAGAAALLEAYLYSPELIAQQDESIGLQLHFDHSKTDLLRKYFREKVTLRQSPDAPLLTLRVQAFTPEFTQELADSLFQALRLKWNAIHAQSNPEEASLILIAGSHRPGRPISPRPFRGIATVFVLSALLYGIGRLLLATVRDHSV